MSLLSYYRATLADGARPRVDFSRARAAPPEAVRAGRLDPALAAAIVRDAPRRITAPPQPDAAVVLIAPTLFSSRFDHNARVAGAAMIAPFILPAVLDAEGALRPHAAARPWIPRDHLDGAAGDGPMIGALEACDRFLERHAADPLETWAAVVAWLDAMGEAVAGARPDRLDLPDHVRAPSARLTSEPPPVPARHVLDLIRDLDPVAVPGCLPTLARPQPPQPLLEGAALRAARRAHVGAMAGLWPLAARQRAAVHHVGALAEGEIIAVAGPPGTGKTTLIRSLVATRVVEAALAGPLAAPPVIVVASTNNRAIRSAVESLDAADLPPDLAAQPLARRWIAGVGSFAMLMPAASKAKAFDGLQMGLFGPQPSGIVTALHAPESVAAADRSILDNAALQFGRAFERVEEAADALHGALRSTVAAMTALIDAADQALAALADDAPPLDDAHARRAQALAAEAALADVEAAVERAARRACPGPLWAALLWLSGRRQARWLDARAILRDAGFSQPPFDSLRPLRRADLLAALEAALRAARERTAAESAAAEVGLRAAEARAAALSRWSRLAGDMAAGDWATGDMAAGDMAAGGGAAGGGATGGGATGAAAALAVAARDDPAQIDALLDVSLRPRAFLLAARWWETQWLLRTRRLQRPGKPLSFLNQPGREGGVLRFRHLACVTPCFVTTLHMLPRHFGLWHPDGGKPAVDKRLTGLIDLLIVDEAGQVAPELGGPCLALARRAAIVGDIHQIEPIPAVSVAADLANLAKVGFTPAQAATMARQGLTAATGSLMQAAHSATAFSSPCDEGLFLNEHRRCPAEIVAFCNDLVYGGRLLARTPQGVRRLAPLGWAHVRGVARAAGAGWRNEQEAAEIAGWLGRRGAQIEAWFGGKIADLVAIVTPYAAQAATLRAALREAGLPRAITVGTVHALQGAERRIVLFSPTVTSGALKGPPFFDRTPNMLNVAASRARDAFLTFGDMALFDASGPSTQPSSVLARHLFRDPLNEIADVTALPELMALDRDALTLLATLDAHRAALGAAFGDARESLIIVSPWISAQAVAADDVARRVRDAVARGVAVTIAYNRGFMAEAGRAAQGSVIDALRSAGARLAPTREHSKALVVDDRWFAVGSFNWLSALRESGSRFAMGETSLRYDGDKAPALCAALVDRLGLMAADAGR